MSGGLPQIVSDAVYRRMMAQKAALVERVVFAEEFAPDRFVKIVVAGEWGADMAEAIITFMARRDKAPTDTESVT